MAPQPSWWSRNWKWAAPAGCLALFSCGCLGFVVLGLGAAGAGVAAMASAGPMDEALQAATSDPEVQRVLGTPIKSKLLERQLSIQTTNGRGHATMTLPLDGPTADGTLHAEADKDGETWNFSRLVVTVPGSRDIDLLESSGGSAPPSEPRAPRPPRPPAPPPLPGGTDAPRDVEPPSDPGDTQDDSDINL